MAVHGLDHEGEGRVEEFHHLLRRPIPGIGGEIADVQEHHADRPDVAGELRRGLQQAIDDRGRDMLAEEVGHPLARRAPSRARRNLARSRTATRPATMPAMIMIAALLTMLGPSLILMSAPRAQKKAPRK